jgi:type II secretory pathway pseudopilin PulG
MISPGRLPAAGRGAAGTRRDTGTSLLETLAAAAAAVILAAVSVPAIGGQRGALQAAAAARHVSALAHSARAEALARGVHVALVFRPMDQDFRFALFADGNYDGVRSADITAGVDRQVSSWVRLGDQFPGARFGIVAGATDPDSGTVLTGSPLKIGGSGVLSFGPAGGTTSGTLYVRGPGDEQFAIRLLGSTGRRRVLRYRAADRRWYPS